MSSFEKCWFGKGKITKFENMDVIIPIDSDAYLKNIYRNYMELPPVEKRIPPHCYLLDTKKSYTEHLKK